MKIYKVCYNKNSGFNIYTYDFWSYVFSRKHKDGLLFFNAEKAEEYADTLNFYFKEAEEIVAEKYKKLSESFFNY